MKPTGAPRKVSSPCPLRTSFQSPSPISNFSFPSLSLEMVQRNLQKTKWLLPPELRRKRGRLDEEGTGLKLLRWVKVAERERAGLETCGHCSENWIAYVSACSKAHPKTSFQLRMNPILCELQGSHAFTSLFLQLYTDLLHEWWGKGRRHNSFL